MELTEETGPAVEPFTVAEAAAFCRIDATNQEPAPTEPTVALGTGAGNVDDGAHRYRVTFVTADGETEGGTISSAVTVLDKTANGKVALSAIPTGGAFVTSRKLYRTAAGGSTYLLLATLADNSTTTYSDNIADASLGAGCPSTNTTSDSLLSALIATARIKCETETHRQLITATYKLTMDRFPADGIIQLPRPPLQSVTTIKYLDDDGDEQTLSAAYYAVHIDALIGFVQLDPDYAWPSTRSVRNAVRIEYVCGYGVAPSSIPSTLISGMKMLVSQWNEYRESFVTGTIVAPLPDTVQSLFSTAWTPTVMKEG